MRKKWVEYAEGNINGCTVEIYAEVGKEIWELIDPDTANTSAVIRTWVEEEE